MLLTITLFHPSIYLHSCPLSWPTLTRLPTLISHTSRCLTSFKLLLHICPCANSTPNVSQADSAAPPLHLHLRLCASLFCRPFSTPSISLQAGSHLSHWSHYQLLPNRKKASLLSWGSRCLPIVVAWSDSEIYSHRPGRRTCVCVCTIRVCHLIDRARYSHFVFLCWPTGLVFLSLHWPTGCELTSYGFRKQQRHNSKARLELRVSL